MKRETNNKNITLQRILAAAQTEFADKGFGGASVETIARNAKVTRQLVHHYFNSKEGLYEATLELVSRNAPLLLDLNDYDRLGAIEAITLIVDRIIDENINYPLHVAMGMDQGLHHAAHITDSNLYIPNTKRFIHDIIKPILERGAATGELRDELNDNLVYWLIFHVVTGCFRDSDVMSKTSDVDFKSPEGIEIWRQTSLQFILSALRK